MEGLYFLLVILSDTKSAPPPSFWGWCTHICNTYLRNASKELKHLPFRTILYNTLSMVRSTLYMFVMCFDINLFAIIITPKNRCYCIVR